MRSWIYGYFGHDNIGDNAILESVLLNLRRINQEPKVFTDNVSVSLATIQAQYVRSPPFDTKNNFRGLKYKMGYWLREGRHILPSVIFDKNVCIYACGGAINDHVPGRVEMIRRRIKHFKKLGFRIGILGAGVNTLVTEIDKEAARSAITELVDYCSVRDSESADALDKIGVPKERYQLATDTVFSLPNPAQWSHRSGPLHDKNVGLNLRPLFEDARERGSDKSRHLTDYIRNTQKLIDNLSRSVRSLELIPMSQDDEQFFNRFTLPTNVQMRGFSRQRDALMRCIASLDVLIGSRFHALVFSIKMGVPFVVIPYSPKVISLAHASGIEYASLFVGDGGEVDAHGLDVDAVHNELQHTWEHSQTISNRFLRLAAHYSHLANEDFNRCWSTLCAAPER